MHPWREQLEFVHLLVLVVVRADHKAQLVYANAFLVLERVWFILSRAILSGDPTCAQLNIHVSLKDQVATREFKICIPAA